MNGYPKNAVTPFDAAPINGLFFLDGDLVGRKTGQNWTQGMKYPLLNFPSHTTYEIWAGRGKNRRFIVHLFGEMDLELYSDRDSAFVHAHRIAEAVGYLVHKGEETEIEVIGHDLAEHLIITYDNAQKVMVDVRPAPKPMIAPARPLLDEPSRAKLPPLYSNEHLGLEALAQVKFFQPDGGWIWFASEGSAVDADGYYDTDKPKVDFLFFGLVIGFEIEFGFFSLSELTEAHGALGLPIERDLYFEPRALGELEQQYRAERGGW